MGLSFSVLGSSSSGNCTLVRSGDTAVLVDAGLPLRYISNVMERYSGRLDGIVVSHEHIDHVRSLRSVAGMYGAPVYMSASVEFILGMRDRYRCERLSPDRAVSIGDIRVTPFLVSHDAIEPFGFVIEGAGRSMGIVTDIGSIEEGVVDRLSDRDAIVVESNYDRDMLMRGPYPYQLKTRIMKGKGHLSNVQCSELIRMVVTDRTREVVLAHLSEENNDPLLAMEASMPSIGGSANLSLSYPRIPTGLFELA